MRMSSARKVLLPHLWKQQNEGRMVTGQTTVLCRKTEFFMLFTAYLTFVAREAHTFNGKLKTDSFAL